MDAKINIRDNKVLMRFETGEGDNTAYLEYRFYKGINIALMHTVVPDQMKGQGKGLKSFLNLSLSKEILKESTILTPRLKVHRNLLLPAVILRQ